MTADLTTYSQNGLDIYFQSQRAGLDAQLVSRLVNFINATQTSLDCAIYDLRQPDVLNALAGVVQAGKQLRIAYDASGQQSGTSDPAADPKPAGNEKALQSAGLLNHATPVHNTGRHLMHNKFLLRDDQNVWTGSANFTQGGLVLQDNQCMVVASPELVASYSSTFEKLLQDDHHQQTSSGSGTLTVSGIALTPFFTPFSGEDVENAIIKALTGVQKVRIMAFVMSDGGILDALASLASGSNADIKGVYDPNGMVNVQHSAQANPQRFWFLNDSRFVRAPSHPFNPTPGHEQDFMHNKVMIIDDHLVVTGSYNFSENAEANDENVLIIDAPAIAAAYTAYFDTLFTKYTHAVPAGEVSNS